MHRRRRLQFLVTLVETKPEQRWLHGSRQQPVAAERVAAWWCGPWEEGKLIGNFSLVPQESVATAASTVGGDELLTRTR
jgi:hypothetical protein